MALSEKFDTLEMTSAAKVSETVCFHNKRVCFCFRGLL